MPLFAALNVLSALIAPKNWIGFARTAAENYPHVRGELRQVSGILRNNGGLYDEA
jgi:hypothetical protein